MSWYLQAPTRSTYSKQSDISSASALTLRQGTTADCDAVLAGVTPTTRSGKGNLWRRRRRSKSKTAIQLFAQDPALFARHPITEQLLANQKRLEQEIDAMDGDEVLNTNPDTLADYFVEKFFATAPILKETDIEVSQREVREQVHLRYTATYIGTEFSYHVPYEGDENLFSCRPTQHTLNPPRATVTPDELIINIRIFPQIPQTTDPVAAQFDSQLKDIRTYLENQRRDLASYNNGLRSLTVNRIATRRQKLLADRQQVASLGYPIRQRPGASTYAIPTVRRKVSIQRPSGGKAPFAPEPTLAMEEYEHILKITASVGRAIEQSPSAFKGLREEDLRTHFLVQLNGWYEGQATGETFNLSGKTDIIIKEKARNVFIAECKFWTGPQGVLDAIDQLLGYASWRDTKTALLLFNRERNLSAVLAKIPSTVKEHPSYVRSLEYQSETGFRFVLRHPDDPGRELTLTLLVFEVPSR